MKLALLVVLLAGCVREAQSSSQGQQDGIVRSIFEVISTTNRYFVELGFDAASYEDPGATGSNTHALYGCAPRAHAARGASAVIFMSMCTHTAGIHIPHRPLLSRRSTGCARQPIFDHR